MGSSKLLIIARLEPFRFSTERAAPRGVVEWQVPRRMSDQMRRLVVSPVPLGRLSLQGLGRDAEKRSEGGEPTRKREAKRGGEGGRERLIENSEMGRTNPKLNWAWRHGRHPHRSVILCGLRGSVDCSS